MENEVLLVPDKELEKLANRNGPTSIEAQVLDRLRSARAKDRQYFAFVVGDYWITGPIPDARTEAAMIEFAALDDE